MRIRLALISSALLVLASGCSIIVDGRITEGEVNCLQEPDGFPCGDMSDGFSRICLNDVCVLSECGDGFVDESIDEQCDEADMIAGDGCEPGTCQFSCEEDEDCSDGNVCTGEETCDTASHTCVAGTPANGAACTQPNMSAGVCNMGQCVPEGCGDGQVDMGEECDDGNSIAGDGCESNCEYTCESDTDCNDGDPCNGEETCNVMNNTCNAGTTLVCDPPTDACHVQGTCEQGVGCPSPTDPSLLIDGDGDGHAANSLGACGSDCDDTDASAYEGAIEICGDGVDNNCVNGTSDEGEITWYADCDGDEYAVLGATTRVACEKPSTTAASTGCPDDNGDWTPTNPNTLATRDCADQEPDAHPGAFSERDYDTWPTGPIPGTSSWDWNCDGTWERYWQPCSGVFCTFCFIIINCNPAVSCCDSGGDPQGWKTSNGDPPNTCGSWAVYEYCGDESANSNCLSDVSRQQRCI